MILAAAVVAIIDGQYRRAGLWFCVGSLLSAIGLMHGWQCLEFAALGLGRYAAERGVDQRDVILCQ